MPFLLRKNFDSTFVEFSHVVGESYRLPEEKKKVIRIGGFEVFSFSFTARISRLGPRKPIEGD